MRKPVASVLEMPRRSGPEVQPTDPNEPNTAEVRRAVAVSLEVIGLTLSVAARRAGVGINDAADLYVEHSQVARNRAYQEGYAAGKRSLLPIRRAAA
jgi:hypothetical protein